MENINAEPIINVITSFAADFSKLKPIGRQESKKRVKSSKPRANIALLIDREYDP